MTATASLYLFDHRRATMSIGHETPLAINDLLRCRAHRSELSMRRNLHSGADSGSPGSALPPAFGLAEPATLATLRALPGDRG